MERHTMSKEAGAMLESESIRRSTYLSLPPASLSGLMRAAEVGESGAATCKVGDGSCAAAQAAVVNRRAAAGDTSLHRSLLQLQRNYGNRFVGQVLRHADGSAGGGEGEGVMDVVERSIESARGGGQSMDHGTRGKMETSFGADFGGVRIHTDTRADTLSQSLSARAFTTGKDVFFRQGEYNPGTTSGRELLAHELTHVVQQNSDAVRTKLTVSDPGDAHEIEADQMARSVIEREQSQGAVDRQPEAPSTDEDEKKLHAKAEAVDRAPEDDTEPQ
jgi:hypothetical protein